MASFSFQWDGIYMRLWQCGPVKFNARHLDWPRIAVSLAYCPAWRGHTGRGTIPVEHGPEHCKHFDSQEITWAGFELMHTENLRKPVAHGTWVLEQRSSLIRQQYQRFPYGNGHAKYWASATPTSFLYSVQMFRQPMLTILVSGQCVGRTFAT